MLRRSPKLHLCPLCGSESVFEWATTALGDDLRSRVTLTCAECETTRVLVATTWAVDAYSRRHERQRFQIALALKRAERERMAADAHVLAEALRHDLIGPDDFRAPRGGPRPSNPGTGPSPARSRGDVT